MKYMHSEWKARLRHWMETLRQDIYLPLGPIEVEAFLTMDHLTPDEAAKGTFTPMPHGTKWGRTYEYCWMHSRITLPAEAQGKRIVMNLTTGGETTVFVDGRSFGTYRADWVANPMHFLVDNVLTACGEAGRTYDLLLEAYAGHFWPQSPLGGCATGPVLPGSYQDPKVEGERATLGDLTYGIWNEDAYHLYMDVDTLQQLVEQLDPESLRADKIAHALEQFTLLADFEQPLEGRIASYKAAREALRPALEAHNGSTAPVFYAIGNAHLDLAWLWPMAETHRKTSRTFAAQLRLLEEYPEYKFLQSQPASYVMCREHYPELYERVKQAIREGRWVAEGAMWVEPDTNMTSGESLVRQVLHGKRFFKDEFGIDSVILWLPDTFGYSAALPQILKSCGVKYLVTQKIFWSYNEGDQFPYHYFTWQGADGSKIDTFLPTSYTYRTDPKELCETWGKRVQKRGLDAFLLPYGYGDGGGGPCRDHIEYALREKDLEGMPRVRMETPTKFFEDMEADGGPQHTYVGELYFSAHRGVFTSQAAIKRGNRKAEIALREAEMWGSLAMVAGAAYPLARMDAAWKRLLLNQFHDILPGSAIHEVYEVTREEYAAVAEKLAALTDERLAALTPEGDGVTVFNTTGFVRGDVVTLPDATAEALADETGCVYPVQKTADGAIVYLENLPAKGRKGFAKAAAVAVGTPFTLSADGHTLETPFYTVRFDEHGQIAAMFDKDARREVFKEGQPGNALRVFEDKPIYYDNWDIDNWYTEKFWDVTDVKAFTWTENGPVRATLHIERSFSHSTISQDIHFYANVRRVDFVTHVDWHEHQSLLKAFFPADVHTDEATFEVQYGNLTRKTHSNTSWDVARFESCGQKWCDVSEGHYGVSVLNDCKYGHSVKDGCIGLTLIKSGIEPNPVTDQEQHVFTYALYPHQEGWQAGGTVPQAYFLNQPALAVAGGSADTGVSLASVDAPNVVLETVKRAEDGDGVILRLYECENAKTPVTLTWNKPFASAEADNCIEEKTGDVEVSGNQIRFTIKPYEVKTIRIR